jgi:outer membrane protein OmpA-like peptidoglycan-associated protein
MRKFIVGAITLTAALAVVVLTAAAQQPSKQPEFKTVKADFVPGDKTIFFDDFTDMAPGDAPPHLKTRGAAPELREAGMVRQLTATADCTLTPNLKGLPPHFTYEMDVKFDVPNGRAGLYVLFFNNNREALTWMFSLVSGQGTSVLSTKVPKYEEFGRKTIKIDLSQPVKLALWVQEGRLRVFVNGEKQLDFNQVEVAPIERVEMQPHITGKGPTVGIRTVRIAESTPDVGKVILASGRYVSHAIQFDTNSDRLKPESAAPIQAIARALAADPGLKLLIEGHTDSVGNADANLTLSRRRADAVKSVLVSQFGVDAARLTTSGLGAGKPLDTNDTPGGRAQNRRVEFVKQ